MKVMVNNSLKAIYFSHDCNARNDEKILALRMKHKSAGYGVFWMIVERLGESNDYMSIKDYDIIAFDLREDPELIRSVIEDFGLFEFTEDNSRFYSRSFLDRMAKKNKDVISGIKGSLIRHKGIKKQVLDKLTDSEIFNLNEKIKLQESKENRGGNIAPILGVNKPPNSNKEKKRKEKKEKKEKKERESTQFGTNYFEFLKQENHPDFETFLMQNRRQVNDWNSMIDNFNNKIDIEISQDKIDFEFEQLFPRFKMYCRSWIKNQNPSTPEKQAPSFQSNRRTKF